MKALATALVNMRRTPYQTLTASLMLTISFFVAFCFSFFAYSAQTVLNFFETKPQVIAFFDLETPTSTQEEAKNYLLQKDYVTKVNLVSQEKALEIYKEQTQDDPLLLELVSAEILPASIEVSGVDINSLSQIKADLEKINGIEDIELPEDILESLSFWTKSLRNIGLGIIGILAIESLLIILVITSMKVSFKRKAIGIMNLLGASNWFISGPFIIEGMLYGLIGATIGWTFMYILILYLTPWLKGFVSPAPLFPIPIELYLFQYASGAIFGILLGAFSSSLAVKRMLKR